MEHLELVIFALLLAVTALAAAARWLEVPYLILLVLGGLGLGFVPACRTCNSTRTSCC